jgi:cyanophycinase
MGKVQTSKLAPGPLVVIGGAEDKTGECAILGEFVRLAGGALARIVVLTVASDYPLRVGATYAERFGDLGARAVQIVHVERREDAGAPDVARAIRRATGIFFTGGTQARIPRLLGGSAAERAIRERHRQGAVVAGTSAGAAAMSSVMIVDGLGARSPRIGSARQGAGLGFLTGVIVDQHFTERGRLGRLLFAVAEHPRHLGLGIDEDTAAVVRGEQLEVIGTGAVTIVDGSGVSYTNVSELTEDAGLLALCDVKLHVLPAGHRFDLRERRPVPRAASGIRRLHAASA